MTSTLSQRVPPCKMRRIFERLLLGHQCGDEWIIVTPGGNEYVDGFGSNEFDRLRVLPMTGGLPAGVVGEWFPLRAVPTTAERADCSRPAKTISDASVLAFLGVDGAAVVLAAFPSDTKKLPRKSSEADGAVDAIMDEVASEPRQLEVAPSMAGRSWFVSEVRPGSSLEADAMLEGCVSRIVIRGKGVCAPSGSSSVFGKQKGVTMVDKEYQPALWAGLFLCLPEAYHKWWTMRACSLIEAICRRLQLVEYQYCERIRDGSSGAVGHRVTGAVATLTGLAVVGGEDADLFDGLEEADRFAVDASALVATEHPAGGSCVALAWLPVIPDELAKTAAIDQAARKDREEKACVRAGVQFLPTSPMVPPEHDKGAGKPGKKQR